MRLEMREDQGNQQFRNVLYFPDGSRYLFPLEGSQGLSTYEAEKFIDRNGNITTFNQTTRKWTDTMGRELTNPLGDLPPQAVTQTYNAKGINNADVPYEITWSELDDVFENPQNTQLKYLGEDNCQSVLTNSTPISPALFHNQPADTLDDQIEGTTRVIRKQRACAAYWSSSQTPFKPVVMASIKLPNGQKYEFKYNEYAEITKIQYPTGGYERFEYDYVEPIGFSALEVYKQANRGVKRRFVSFDGVNETQVWNYSSNGTTITTTAPDGSRSERDIYHTENSAFGSSDPRNGMVKEERVYDASSNHVLRSRTLTDWEVTAPEGTGMLVPNGRDPRPVRTISIMYEGSQILATMSETDYDTPGVNGVPTDPSYFARLNAKQSKSYHYLSLTSTEANEGYDNAIVNLKNKFHNSGQLASTGQTDYSYSSTYRARGIIGLPTDTRVLNASSPADILAKSQIIYDGGSLISAGTSSTWQDPNSNLRGNATTTRTWVKETDTWLETTAQYDNFGNLRKAWDLNVNLTETEYSSTYNYAYPTKVIAPAPDPDNTGHGTTEKSEATTSYDLTTGLPLTVTNLNDLTTSADDQTTATEYDGMLRPKRVYPVNFTAPEAKTEYGVPDSNGQFPENQRFVKTLKQIDATNWDEAIVWFDGLGRTIKTQAKDSQGDVFTETKYDNFGRVKWTSNPYRVGDTKYWSRPRYDELNRVYESCAPVEESQIDFNANGACPSGTSLGTTSFSISTVSNFVGTVVTSTDASGRKARSITNALGQLLRVDEATATSTNANADLGDISNPNQPTYYNYSPQGKMVKVKQGKDGDQYIQYRYFKYDSFGRLIRVNQPEQEINPALDLADNYNTSGHWTAAFAYDLLGNVKRATDANGTNIINEYDKANRITKKCYTIQNITTSALNCADATANLDPNTPTVEYFYDGKGLEGSVAPRVGTVNPAFAKGKLTKVTSSVSETRYTQFDYLGRLLQMEQRTPVSGENFTTVTPRVSSYEYNFAGALIKETYPSGRVVKNEFEADGDLSRIYGKASTPNAIERTYANAFTYTADGKIEKLKLGNNRWEWAKFNNRLQVTELALGRGVTDSSLWDLKYEYGELQSNGVDVDQSKNTGNIAKQTLNFAGLPNPLVQTYRFDSLYRLTEARETNGTGTTAPQTWKETFSYDRFGNRQTHQKFTGTTQLTLDTKANPTINSSTNRFNEGQNILYDKNGNIIEDRADNNVVRTFVFDGNNKQRFIVQAGSNLGEYFYDGEGNRVKKKVYESNGTTVKEETIFVYSAGKLVAEYSTKPLPTNPTTSYTATDQLGSPRVITDSIGNVISRRDFMPFGEEITNQIGEREPLNTDLKYNVEDSVRQKFTGYQKDDETGLDFAEARMYENRHGRFTAVDPLLASGKSANPQTFNRYVYVGNNPIIKIDPTGLVEWYTDGANTFRWSEDNKKFNDQYGNESIDTDKWQTVKFDATGSYYYTAVNGAIIGLNQGSGDYSYTAPTNPGNTNSNQGNDTVRAMLGGFDTGLNNFRDAAVTGIKNVPINFANFVTDSLTLSEVGIPFIVSYRHGLWNNPFQIQRFEYSSQRSAELGSAFETGIPAGLAVVGGVFRGGGSSLTETLSVTKPEFIGPKQLPYAPRVRARGVQDPKSHNFPYSFDNLILSTKPRVLSNGYRIYQKAGTMGRYEGLFEIGVTEDFIIDHRFFRKTKKIK